MFLGQTKPCSVGLFCGLQGKNWGITTGPFYRHHYMTLLLIFFKKHKCRTVPTEGGSRQVEFITYVLNAFLLNVKIFNFSCKLQTIKMFKNITFLDLES